MLNVKMTIWDAFSKASLWINSSWLRQVKSLLHAPWLRTGAWFIKIRNVSNDWTTLKEFYKSDWWYWGFQNPKENIVLKEAQEDTDKKASE